MAKMQGSSGDTAFTFDGNTAAAAEGGMQSSPGTGTGESGAAMEVDEKDDEERAEAGKMNLDEIPKWAHNLDPSCKKLPTSGLINCDANETAAQIIDNGINGQHHLIARTPCQSNARRVPQGYGWEPDGPNGP